MPARLNRNQIIAAVVAVFAVVYLYGAFSIPRFPIPRPIDSDLIPKILGFAMLGLAMLLFFQKPDAEEARAAEADPGAGLPWSERPKVQVVLTLLGVAVYAALLRPLGFLVASALLVGGLAALYGYRNWGINAVVSIAVPLVLYLTLTRFMAINLPRGILPF